MKREIFLNKFNKADSHVDKKRLKKLLKRSIHLGDRLHKNNSGTLNMIICMEELSELQKEISKYLRHKGDKVALTEEIADVCISLEYIKLITGIDQDDINKAINIKLDRLEERDKDL